MAKNQLGKKLKELHPDLDSLMFTDKNLISKDKEKKKYKEWQKNKKRNH